MVSIIIPVFNVEEYLRECVESVAKQTLADIEIILVDDGSTDGSAKICDEYVKTDSRVIVIHQENSGSTAARNAGVMASRGEYIGFVDSDDWIEPEMYAELLACCEEHGADIATSVKFINHGKSEYREESRIPAGCYDRGANDRVVAENLIYTRDFSGRGISPNLCDKLFKRELLLKYQLTVDERIRYGEDDVCVYSCVVNAERLVVTDMAFYHYRQRGGSVCHTCSDTYFEGITRFYRQLREQFERHPHREVLMDQLDRYMAEFAIRGVNRHFGLGYGVIVPFYLPPYDAIRHARKVALYGAGNVGQDYYRALRLWGGVQVSVWVDRQHEDYRGKGLPVDAVTCLESAEYDCVLVAVEKEGLAERIRGDLVRLGVADGQIIYRRPERLIQNLERGQY